MFVIWPNSGIPREGSEMLVSYWSACLARARPQIQSLASNRNGPWQYGSSIRSSWLSSATEHFWGQSGPHEFNFDCKQTQIPGEKLFYSPTESTLILTWCWCHGNYCPTAHQPIIYTTDINQLILRLWYICTIDLSFKRRQMILLWKHEWAHNILC